MENLNDYLVKKLKEYHVSDDSIRKFLVTYQKSCGVDLSTINKFYVSSDLSNIGFRYNDKPYDIKFTGGMGKFLDMYNGGFTSSFIECSYANAMDYREVFEYSLDDTFRFESEVSNLPYEGGRELEYGGFLRYSGHVGDDMTIDSQAPSINPYTGEEVKIHKNLSNGELFKIDKKGKLNDYKSWESTKDTFAVDSLDDLSKKRTELFDYVKSNTKVDKKDKELTTEERLAELSKSGFNMAESFFNSMEVTGRSLNDYLVKILKEYHVSDDSIRKFLVTYQKSCGVDLSTINKFNVSSDLSNIGFRKDDKSYNIKFTGGMGKFLDMYNGGFTSSFIECSYANAMDYREVFEYFLDDTFRLESEVSNIPHENGSELEYGGFLRYSGHVGDDMTIDSQAPSVNPYTGEEVKIHKNLSNGELFKIDKKGKLHDYKSWESTKDTFAVDSLDGLSQKKSELFDYVKSNTGTLDNNQGFSR